MSHYVDALETIYCTNCGVSSTTETCKRCMEMTQCPSCKRRLPSYCYFAGSGSLCEVRRVANITVFIDVVVAAVAADVVVFMNVSVVTRLCNTFVQVVWFYTHKYNHRTTHCRVAPENDTDHISEALWVVSWQRSNSQLQGAMCCSNRSSTETVTKFSNRWMNTGVNMGIVCLFVCFGVYGQLGDRLRLLS